MSLRTEWLHRLQEALDSYYELDEDRDTTLAGLSTEAEDSGCYREFDYARSDWSETMDEAGQSLASALKEFLNLALPAPTQVTSQ